MKETIYKEDAIKAFDTEPFIVGDAKAAINTYSYLRNVIRKIKNLPPAEPQKKGKWERHNTYYGDDTSGFVDPDWRCSECGKRANVNEWFMYDLTDYCPNCGADMRGEQDG